MIENNNEQVGQPNANTNVVGSLFVPREKKFRAWHTGEKKWWFFDFFDLMCGSPAITDNRYRLKYRTEWTGLNDKNGKEIYEGDIVRCNKPYRTTQTHEGDNIPNGSYTEPMEPGIKTIDCEVRFKDGTFYLDSEDDVDYNMTTPILWYNIEWNLEMIKDAISWTRQDAGWFDDPEEGDLQYLITECAKVENEEQLIKHLSGLEIIGNVFENPELLQTLR